MDQERFILQEQSKDKNCFKFNRLSTKILYGTIALLFALFAVIYSVLLNEENNWDIQMNTLEGDPGVLKDLKIEGVILDYSEYIIKFEIEGEKLTQSMERSKKAINEYIFNNFSTRWDHLNTQTAQYDLGFEEDATSFFISRRLKDNNNIARVFSYIQLRTSYTKNATAVEDSHNFPDNYYETTEHYGTTENYYETNETKKGGITINVTPYTPVMQEVDGKLYFIIPKVQEYGGDSGLYVVDHFDPFRENQSYRKLADIPLNGGENELITLTKVNETLCLIRYNDNGLILQAFNWGTQAFEQPYTDKDVVLEDPDAFESGIQYVFSNDAFINVVFMGGNGYNIYTYSLENEVKRQTQLFGLENDSDNPTTLKQIFYHNNMLYIVQKLMTFPRDIILINISSPPEEHTFIRAYDTEGKLCYLGELDSFVNDDLIRYKKYNQRLQNTQNFYVPVRRTYGINISALKK